MNFNDLTIGQAKQLADMFTKDTDPGPWEIGANYLIRTVTMTLTGRLVSVYPQELMLQDAAWIADTGRFANAVEMSSFEEVEPFPEGRIVGVGRGAVVDFCKITTLPRSQK
uniref:Uncharacterized protein n=1 Tax=viral metagenome TaxID=1070528 RepID=A0A6H1ZLD6_9ZZZZ